MSPGLMMGLGAVGLAVLAIVAVLFTPLRQTVFGAAPPVAVATPTHTTGAVLAAPTTASRTGTPGAQPTAQTAGQPAAQTPIAVAATPAAAPPGAPPTLAPRQPTAAPAPLTPNQRLATARDAADAGNYAAALQMIADLRTTNPTLADLDNAEYDVHMAFAQALLKENNADGAYQQFGGALKIRPGDQAAKSGQDGIVLAKNYAIMEASWGRDDDAGIKALDENMSINPDYRETRQKLYALLIMKADRLIGAGERDAAFEVLMRALTVQPDAGEAQKRLATYTPTPTPEPTAAPAPAYTAPAPAYSAPAQQQTRPVSQPAQQQTRPAAQPASRPASSGGAPGSSCPGGVCP
jgi:hypothetical protein